MKTKILDEIPYNEELIKKGVNGKLFIKDMQVDIRLKKSKSFIIIENNVVQYFERHKMVDGLFVKNDDNPFIITPFANFKIRKLTEDTNKGYLFSSYKIKIDFAGINSHWYFIDLNWWKYLRIQFNANNSWINKSNIYKFIYAFVGAILGVLGTLITQLFSVVCN